MVNYRRAFTRRLSHFAARAYTDAAEQSITMSVREKEGGEAWKQMGVNCPEGRF